MKTVTFTKKSIYGAKGETREVTSLSAAMFEKMGIVEVEKKEEVVPGPEPEVDTKEAPEPDTKKAKGRPAKEKEVKVTKAPKL